jgi:signal transduction histidine kinase
MSTPTARRSDPRPSPAQPGPEPPAAPAPTSAPPAPTASLEDFRRPERTMIAVRWLGALFAAAQVIAYRTEPYPPGVEALGLALAGALAAANVGIWVAHLRIRTIHGAFVLSVTALAIDVALASAFVWLYAFDAVSALWAILFILPLEGAIRFGLNGAVAAWAASTVLYAAREIWAVDRYGRPLEVESITFRMGIGFLIALVAGMMARSLTRQRAQLSGTLVELSRTDALRSRLVATLAHDVRNPLTTIRGTLKTLARHSDRLDDRTRSELIATADRQAERLERLAGDLLDLARMERGRLDLHPVTVPVREAVARGLSYAHGEERFELLIDPDLVVWADPDRLEQVVVNLVTNALRHGEPPFVIEAGRRGPDVRLTFRDHGPGVPPEELPELFEPFRAEADQGSVGLGLAIVHALTEAMGGSVSYEPSRPRGAAFHVVLPAARSEDPEARRPGTPAPGPR